MSGLVIDASIVLAWYFADEVSPPPGFIGKLIDEPITVPAHFEAEVANGVVMGERRRRSAPPQAAALVAFLDHLELEQDSEGTQEALLRVLPLARAHNLTIYDALYLELAERRGLPLATRDGDLADAARAVGVEVLDA